MLMEGTWMKGGSSANGRQLDKGIDTRGQQLSNSVYLLLILKAT